MMKIALAIALLLVSATLSAAQLYRWVNERGEVEWRDTPPPTTSGRVEQRSVRANTIDTKALPYSVQQAAKNFPVTLWTTQCGDACNKARAHLKRRNVPYTEKDPRKDPEAYKKLTGSLEVPVLFVGRQRLKGYLEHDWDEALTDAGYPRAGVAPSPAGAAPAPQ